MMKTAKVVLYFFLLLKIALSTTAYVVTDTFLCRFSAQPLHANCTEVNEYIPDVCSIIEGCLPELTTVNCPLCSTNHQHYVCDMRGCNASATEHNAVQCQLYHFDNDGDYCAPCDPAKGQHPPSAIVFHCPLPGIAQIY